METNNILFHKHIINPILMCGLCLLSIQFAYGHESKYWVCTTGWWDDPNCWSTSPNGPGGAGQPHPGPDTTRTGYPPGDSASISSSDNIDRTIYYANTLYPISQGTTAIPNFFTEVFTTMGIGATGTGKITVVQTKDDLAVDHFSMRNATYIQSGGLTYTNSYFRLFSNARYNLSGGILWSRFEEEIAGTLTQTGGLHTVYRINVGLGSSNGIYNLSGGDINATTINLNGGSFNQTGGTNKVENELRIQNDTYTLTGGSLNAANITIDARGQLAFAGGELSAENINGDIINYGGTLSPANTIGALNISGDYTQFSEGTLDVDIGGTAPGSEYDFLSIGGTANLGGTLRVHLFDSTNIAFTPALGDIFDILAAPVITGEFDVLLLAMLGDGLAWDVSYILNDYDTDYVRLSIISAVPLPAAFWMFLTGLVGLSCLAVGTKSDKSQHQPKIAALQI